MTVTYTNETPRHIAVPAEDFVPRYARAKRSKKGPRTWMILAPIGLLALVGGGAVMMASAGSDTRSLSDPAPTALVQPAPGTNAGEAVAVESSTPPSMNSPGVSSETPVLREAPPAPPPTVQRRQVAPAQRSERAEQPVSVAQPAARSETAVTEPVAAERAPTVRAPSITVAPLG